MSLVYRFSLLKASLCPQERLYSGRFVGSIRCGHIRSASGCRNQDLRLKQALGKKPLERSPWKEALRRSAFETEEASEGGVDCGLKKLACRRPERSL